MAVERREKVKNFLRHWQLRRQEEKQKEEAEKKEQLVARLRVETVDMIENLRRIKDVPFLSLSAQNLRYNTQIYEINWARLQAKLLGTGVTRKDLGLSDEELAEIYRAAVRADIVNDAPKFGLTVSKASK